MDVTSQECIVQNQEVGSPEWILDRRDSGYLFWRRDASVCDKRVKFRCDVQILEFWPSEEELRENYQDYYQDEIRCRTEDMAPPSNLAGFLCICAMITILTYNYWLSPTP